MNTNYCASWNYEWLMAMAYPKSSNTEKYRNGYMQSLLIHEEDPDIMTRAKYKRSFQKVKANVIKGLTELQNKDCRLDEFIDTAKNSTDANDLNHVCKQVLDLF